jgi:hypothetical protein
MGDGSFSTAPTFVLVPASARLLAGSTTEWALRAGDVERPVVIAFTAPCPFRTIKLSTLQSNRWDNNSNSIPSILPVATFWCRHVTKYLERAKERSGSFCTFLQNVTRFGGLLLAKAVRNGCLSQDETQELISRYEALSGSCVKPRNTSNYTPRVQKHKALKSLQCAKLPRTATHTQYSPPLYHSIRVNYFTCAPAWPRCCCRSARCG